MPYCPDCRYIYRPGVEVCPDCGAELVDEEEHDSDGDGAVDTDEAPGFIRSLLAHPALDEEMDLVPVYRAQDSVMADLIHGVLASEGVDSAVHSQEATALRGVLDPRATSWAVILVAEEDVVHAREVIAAYLAGKDGGVKG